MANVFLDLPAPAANGSGAAVDVSSMGANKTIVVGGSWVLPPIITVEFNNAASSSDGSWQALKSFNGGGSITLPLAARWMRVTVANFRGGVAPDVSVASDDSGTTFATLVVPSGNGTGASVATAALPSFKTVQIGGSFRGACVVEISADNGQSWAPQFTFYAPGAQSGVFTADLMRVTRNGVPQVAPGSPVCNVGAAEGAGGGGGGGGGVAVSAGTQLATSGTVALVNSNGVSFGMSGSSQITASIPAGATATGNLAAISAGTTSASNGTIVLSNSNNVSFGMNGSTVTAIAPYELAIFAASSTTVASTQRLYFDNAFSVAWGLQTAPGASTVRINAQFSAIKRISAGTTNIQDGNVSIADSNGISFGLNGQTLTAVAATLTGTGTQIVQAMANSNLSIFGSNVQMAAGGNVVISAPGLIRASANNSASFQASNAVQINATNDMTISAGSSMHLTGSNVTVSAGANMRLTAISQISLIASNIVLSAVGSNITVTGPINSSAGLGSHVLVSAGSSYNVSAGNMTLTATAGLRASAGADIVMTAGSAGVYAGNTARVFANLVQIHGTVAGGAIEVTGGSRVSIAASNNSTVVIANSNNVLGFFGSSGTSKGTITGASTDVTLVLDNLLNYLGSLGLLSKSTT